MTSRAVSRIALAVAGFALVAAACGGGSDAADPAPADSTAAAPTSGASESESDSDAPADATTAAPALLQFTAPLVGGGDIDAATLAGTPTAFWFWAPT